MLELSRIRIDGGTQSRVELNNATVEEYSEAMAEGAAFPPVVVFFDGANHWLADGFHRYFGADHAGIDSIAADVRNGTQQDAQLFSFSVNADHGLRRSNADKRKSVTGALKHPVSSKWSDNQIAKHCGVHHSTVGDVRRSLAESASDKPAERTYTTKHGTTAVMNTANVGKSKPAQTQAAAPAPASAPTASTKATPAEEIPEDDGPSAEEIAAQVAAEEADRALVAKLLDSNEPLAELAEENKQLKAEIAQLKLARDGYMNRCNEAIALVKSRDRQIAKLEKMLKAEA